MKNIAGYNVNPEQIVTVLPYNEGWKSYDPYHPSGMPLEGYLRSVTEAVATGKPQSLQLGSLSRIEVEKDGRRFAMMGDEFAKIAAGRFPRLAEGSDSIPMSA